MNDKKKGTPKTKAEHTIRCGEATATIYLRQSNAGFVYYDYLLGRTWRQTTGTEAHGSSFFEKNEQDVIRAVQEASAWIRSRMQSDMANQQPNAERVTSEQTVSIASGQPKQ